MENAQVRSIAAEWFKKYRRPDRYFVPAGDGIVLHSMATQEVVAMLEAFERELLQNRTTENQQLAGK